MELYYSKATIKWARPLGPNGRDFCCLIPELVVMGLAGSFITRVLLWNLPSCFVKSELLCIKNMSCIRNINWSIDETYGEKSLQNINHLHTQKLSDYLDKMLMPPCKWKRKHSEMHKSILCLISGIIIMSVSAVELKRTQETYHVPCIEVTSTSYSSEILITGLTSTYWLALITLNLLDVWWSQNKAIYPQLFISVVRKFWIQNTKY